MTFTTLLTQRCVIERKTVNKNDYSHTVVTWAAVHTDIPCRVDYMFVTSNFTSQTPNGIISGNDYIGFFNKDTDILNGDRIIWKNLKLYVRPINFLFASQNSVHHLEVMFGLQET